MKKQFVKKLMTWSLVCAYSPQLFAKPLADFRGNQNQALQAAAKTDVTEILELMGENKANSFGLDSLVDPARLAVFNTNSRLNFATNIKRFLEAGKMGLKFDEQLGRPTTFNPAWSPEESRDVKNERRQYICQSVIKKFDMNKLVESLEQSAEESKKQSYVNITTDPRQKSLLEKLSAVLNAGAKNSKSQTKTDILGRPVALDVVDGYIQEIHLSKAAGPFNDANSISLNLSMLISAKTESEEYYVQAQTCLVRYFQEQSDILEVRRAELTQPGLVQKINKVEQALRSLFERFQQDAKSEALNMSWDKFYQAHLRIVSKEDPTAFYLSKRDQYVLGKNLSPDEEIKQISRRLSQIRNILPYLKEKLTGTLFAHQALVQLSEAQINELLALMIKLQGTNVPTETDLQMIAKKMKSTSGLTDLEVDLMRYKATLDELNNLKMKLQEAKLPVKN